MKKLILPLAVGLLAGLPASEPAKGSPAVPAPAARVVSAADPQSAQELELAALGAIYGESAKDPELRKRNPQAWFRLYDDSMRRYSAAGRAYAEKYPNDPRRFNALIQASYTRPYFITGFKHEFDAAPRETNLLVDEAAVQAHLESQLGYLAEVITTPGLPARQKGGATVAYLTDGQALARRRGVAFDWPAAGAFIEGALAKQPDVGMLPVVEVYRGMLERAQPEAVAAFDAKVAALPGLAEAAATARLAREAASAEKSRKLEAIGAIKFTAADGREVDLMKLRGKVVLVDFWATWCGPCITELPNVVANYQKYHEKGFEVVGITLENPGITPKDQPEQVATKLAQAKAKMLEFTVKNGMPWPQYFDGKWWKNDYAVRFGIELIPAMFLLDQNGNIVATEARGPKLEAEIRRLLKL